MTFNLLRQRPTIHPFIHTINIQLYLSINPSIHLPDPLDSSTFISIRPSPSIHISSSSNQHPSPSINLNIDPPTHLQPPTSIHQVMHPFTIINHHRHHPPIHHHSSSSSTILLHPSSPHAWGPTNLLGSGLGGESIWTPRASKTVDGLCRLRNPNIIIRILEPAPPTVLFLRQVSDGSALDGLWRSASGLYVFRTFQKYEN